MKKYYLFFVLASLSVLASCTNDKKSAGSGNEVVFVFDENDSLKVNELADRYVELFNQSNFEAAAEMLNMVRNDSIFPLTDAQKDSYVAAMKTLPQHGCQKKDVQLRTDLDNRVRVAVLMNPAGDLDTEEGTINMFLNPVKVDGNWYLTVFDNFAEGVGVY